MSRSANIDVLNVLLATHHRSLPMYLKDATPYTRRGDEKAVQTLANIRDDQAAMAARIAELIQRREGDIDTGEFPLTFTDMHFLSMDFLVIELIAYEQREIETIQQCVSELAGDSEARELAEESLGEARAHLEALEELGRQPVS